MYKFIVDHFTVVGYLSLYVMTNHGNGIKSFTFMGVTLICIFLGLEGFIYWMVAE